MRIPRIYAPYALTADAAVQVTGSSFNHIRRVLRLKAGAEVILFDGIGGEYPGRLEHLSQDHAQVRLGAHNPREAESALRIELVQGVARSERMDYTLQKAVELGVERITPVFTERSVVHLSGTRLNQRVEHWKGIVIGACEQCGRNRIPPVESPISLTQWLAQKSAHDLKLVLHHRATRGIGDIAALPNNAITLLIGPEGGLSTAELDHAAKMGFIDVRLGPRILRTETAALVALSVLQARWGDLN